MFSSFNYIFRPTFSIYKTDNIYMYIYMCMYVCIYTYTYVYIDICCVVLHSSRSFLPTSNI